MRRLILAFLASVALAACVVVVLRAEEGPYNTNPPYCRTHGPSYFLWWYYECMYPDDPSWAEGQ